ADQPHRLEAAAAPAAPLAQELGDRAVELLVRAPLRAYRHVVDLAEREGVEDGPRRGPVTPADRGDPQGRRLDRADRGENLDIVRVLAADPADCSARSCTASPGG